MQLSVTNCSIDLTILRRDLTIPHMQCKADLLYTDDFRVELNESVDTYSFQKQGRFDGLVIIAKVVPHVPIPNTTVKPFSADGTSS